MQDRPGLLPNGSVRADIALRAQRANGLPSPRAARSIVNNPNRTSTIRQATTTVAAVSASIIPVSKAQSIFNGSRSFVTFLQTSKTARGAFTGALSSGAFTAANGGTAEQIAASTLLGAAFGLKGAIVSQSTTASVVTGAQSGLIAPAIVDSLDGDLSLTSFELARNTILGGLDKVAPGIKAAERVTRGSQEEEQENN